MTKPFYKVRPIKDLRDLINQSTELYGDRPAFEIKNSKNGHFEITYKRYRNEINCLGTVLTDMGLAGVKRSPLRATTAMNGASLIWLRSAAWAL